MTMDLRRLYDAVDYAVTLGGWKPEHVEAVLRGCARDEKGRPVACCGRCGKPEWQDGLIATEVSADGIVGGFVCPQCKVAG